MVLQWFYIRSFNGSIIKDGVGLFGFLVRDVEEFYVQSIGFRV